MKSAEVIKEAIETVKQKWDDFIDALSNLFKKIKRLFSKRGISKTQKPKDMQEFIEQKKNKKPFYKDDKKKSWE